MDLLCTQGLVESGVVDYVWDDGWRAATVDALHAAQHNWPKYPGVGSALPKQAVVACFATYLPLMLAQLPSDGKYVVVVAPGDPSLNERGGHNCNVSSWPSCVQHVFGPSVIAQTARMTAMPMAFHAFRDSFIDPLAAALEIPRTSAGRVLVSYSLDNPGSVYNAAHERITAIEYFRRQSWATVCEALLSHATRTTNTSPWPWPEYAARLRAHDFLAVPVGYGVERIAQWEAMVLGTIPICLHHPELDHFADMPIAFVSSWQEVTPEWCDANMGLIERRSMEKLRLSYWVERIREKCKEVWL